MKYIKLEMSLKEKLLFLFYSLIAEKHFTGKRPKYRHELKQPKVKKTEVKKVPFFDLANEKIKRKGDWK